MTVFGSQPQGRYWIPLVMACAIGMNLVAAQAQTPPNGPPSTPPNGPPATTAAAATGAPPAAGPSAPAPGQLRPMKDFLKDSKATPGFFTLHQKDDKVWLEILPSQFDKPFFFSYNVPRSVGERGLYGSQMGGSQMAVFKKIGNQIQLIAKNTQFFAKEGTPQAQFVSESFSDSLLSSFNPAPCRNKISIDRGQCLAVHRHTRLLNPLGICLSHAFWFGCAQHTFFGYQKHTQLNRIGSHCAFCSA